MAKDITQTRREKVVVHLDDAGGALRLDALHEWASLKLLCAHQAFSQLMEGMVDDGLVRWDGTSFELTSEGSELATAVRGAAGRAARPAPTPAPPAHDHGHDHGHDRGSEPDHDHGHDHGGGPDRGHDHGHDHGGGPDRDHDHDHGHDHGGHDHDHDHGGGSTSGVRGGRTDTRDTRYGTGEEVDLDALKQPRPRPTPMRPPPPPVEPPKTGGLRSSVKGALKKLLGR